jgi:hypothetical protein
MARVVRHAMGKASVWVQGLGGRDWRFAQLSVRRFSGLVYRLVAASPLVDAPEGGASGSVGSSTSAAVMQAELLLPNEVITTGMTNLACANRAGAVDRAVDD